SSTYKAKLRLVLFDNNQNEITCLLSNHKKWLFCKKKQEIAALTEPKTRIMLGRTYFYSLNSIKFRRHEIIKNNTFIGRLIEPYYCL
ncbi:MAG: Unknown protein, partial [uncultured Aureispira sp.]